MTIVSLLQPFPLFYFLYSFSFFLLCKLTEQFTKEQSDTEAISGETSDLDITTVPELPAEAIKTSLPLSLIDVNETITKDSFSEEFLVDATVEQTGVVEGKDDSKKFTSVIDVTGLFSFKSI